jgi:OFA family oxalate/formate antiporter-like MFS transporter
VFFGWYVVGASLLTALYVGGAVFYGFTTVFEPIASEMGWSYTTIALGPSLLGVEAGLLAPLLGVFADRWGPRRLISGGAVLIAGGLFLLSRTTSLGMFYGALALMAVGISCCTMTVLMTAVTNWFHRRVGLASGIAVSGFGFGGLLIPVMVRLIDVYDWRTTLTILAVGMVVLILPLSLLFRHKPEQYGYAPDGAAMPPANSDGSMPAIQPSEIDVGVRTALKSRTFWQLALAYTVQVLLVSSVVTHVMPYLSSIGIGRSMATVVATAVPLISIVGRFGLGWLGDRVNRRVAAAGAFGMMGLGALCFALAGIAGTWLLVFFLLFFGVGYGGGNSLRPSLGREYFGRASFGTIFGLIIGINMLGGLSGPPLAGWVYDTWGAYQGIWFVFAGLAVVALCLVVSTRPLKTDPPAGT